MTWNIENKRVVLTGGNAGIGLATTIELCRRGARVLFTARDPEKAEQALSRIRSAVPQARVQWGLLDLGDVNSIQSFADRVLASGDALHLLIHNAGLILSDRRESVGGIEMTLMVNHLGPFLLQRLLEPTLIASAPARVIVVASAAHRRLSRGLQFEDLQYRKGYSAVKVYSASKLANILFTRELARRLKGQGVTANCLHPGVVATEFTRDGDAQGPWGFAFKHLRFLLLTPAKGARTSVHLAVDQVLGNVSGEYFSGCKCRQPSRAARDAGAASRLWLESERLLGLSNP